MITMCWIGRVDFGVGDGLCAGSRVGTGFLIPRPVYWTVGTNPCNALSRYREGYATWAATGRRARPRAPQRKRTQKTPRVLARCQLPVGRADLPVGEPPVTRAAPGQAHQTAVTWSLGDHPGPQFSVCASEPRDQGARPRRD